MTYFNEQPDGDIHDECAAEIHRLNTLVNEIKKCLVRWRCCACGHERLEVPSPITWVCEACGVKSPLHGIYSDDREGIVELLKENDECQTS